MARQANKSLKHVKGSNTRKEDSIHYADGYLERIDDDCQTQFDPEISDKEEREEVKDEELFNNDILLTMPSKENDDISQAMDIVTPSTSVSIKAAKLANAFRTFFEPCAPSNLKAPPELRGSGAKAGNFLPVTIDIHASTTPSTMSGLSGPLSSL